MKLLSLFVLNLCASSNSFRFHSVANSCHTKQLPWVCLFPNVHNENENLLPTTNRDGGGTALKNHQKKSKVHVGSRVLLILSQDMKKIIDTESFTDNGMPIPAEVVYEATVERVLTKDTTHNLGIKVQAVGGKCGRVLRILSEGEDAKTIASSSFNVTCVEISANKGKRWSNSDSVLINPVVARNPFKPYSTTFDQWKLVGPAAEAAKLLEGMDEVDKVNRQVKSAAGVIKGKKRKRETKR
jgi:hypothetical protein